MHTTAAAAADTVPHVSPSRHSWRSFKDSKTLGAMFLLLLCIPLNILTGLHNLTGHWQPSGIGLAVVTLTLASGVVALIWLPVILCALLIGTRGPLWRRQLRAYRTGRLTRSALTFGAVIMTSLAGTMWIQDQAGDPNSPCRPTHRAEHPATPQPDTRPVCPVLDNTM